MGFVFPNSADMTAMLGNTQALKPSLPEIKTAKRPVAADMIKSVGGLKNWYKLFPAKAGKWTQVMLAQINVVEANQVPKPLHNKPVEPLNLQGSFQVAFGTGAKSNAVYAFVTRKDPRLGTLSAWYARDIDIARVIGSGLKKVNVASENYAIAAAQDMAVQASVNAAKTNLQGGPIAPPGLPMPSSVGLSIPAKMTNIKVPPVAWYEVAESLILKVEKELPSKPSMAPIPMPTGKNFTAELLAGPVSRWPYAKVVANINGAYVTAWFTIGKAGKNRPGSIILLKRPKMSGSTPAPALDPNAGYIEAAPGNDTGIIKRMPIEMLENKLPLLPLTAPLPSEDNFRPAGFLGEGLVSEGGSSETPLWKNPIVIGGAVLALAGGAWLIYRRK